VTNRVDLKESLWPLTPTTAFLSRVPSVYSSFRKFGARFTDICVRILRRPGKGWCMAGVGRKTGCQGLCPCPYSALDG